MRRRMFFSSILIILAMVGSYGFANTRYSVTQTPDPISGDWDVTFKVGERTSPATFNLKLDGNKVSGTAESAHTGPGTIREGSWVDGKLSFTLDFKTHESITITGKAQDGKLVGEFSTEGFTSSWEATRKK
ncbi:MAG: hypothetical protein ACRD9S_17340 [Pyrinomonadaceae bacterium]